MTQTSGKNVDYDPEAVVEYCRAGAQTSLHALISDLNDLSVELDRCQDTFHCKGGDTSNAVIKIYKGFSEIIGNCNGKQLSGASGLGGVAAATAILIDSVYAEAMTDKQAQEISGFKF